ncbi:type II toxin-antitoxin system HicA family toxin [Microcoleus sp. bin38.metabat.b11b12b14.051]|uniref:type II toxin-antitoxin system HicA family toxin n=1 Tax=Microcoleus sp. bin38.metabat.b11b12b14.051 TaxID=2742709 RepID=UPI0025F69A1C|nr:type II toxin-antitoxin system HicA family toxin [Microcoleus sp. bin38.metabat.b11b12b14.051]
MKQKLPRINPTTLMKSLGRFTLLATFSFSLGTLKNWGHHNSYWHGTIFRVQTVDFNMLSHTLPGKLSYTLLEGNIGELQRTLDSNYGLFGLIVTDCKMATKDCLSEQILYQSKSSLKWTKEISLATLSNHPYDLLQNPPPLQAERQYVKRDDSKPIPTGKVNSGEIIGRVYYVRGVPPTFIEDYTNWIKEPFKVTGSRTLYTSTFALFFVSSLTAWIILELVLYTKRNEQRFAQQQREQLQREAEYEQRLAQQQQKQLQREIQQIKLQLEEKNQQTIELIDQRERGLAELESYRQGQEQNKRELENQIASYESELAFKEEQQQETAQTLEDLQLLRQELQETYQRESEAKQRSEALNQKIADLKRDRDLIQQQSRQLEQQLETIPNINELNAALEGSRAESERIKAGSRDFEVYVLEENHKLEEKKADLNRELNSALEENHKLEEENADLDRKLKSAKEQIRYLQNIMDDNNSLISDNQEIVIDSSSSAGARSRLRNISGRGAVRSLERLGFTEDRQRGSHVILKKTITRTISVPVPIHEGQSLKRGTLRAIIRQADITREDFLDNL